MIKSGQIIVFHQPRCPCFPEIRGPISLTITTIWSENSCFRSRARPDQKITHNGGPNNIAIPQSLYVTIPNYQKNSSETSQPSKIPKTSTSNLTNRIEPRTFHPIHLNKQSTHQPIQKKNHGTNFPIKKTPLSQYVSWTQ